MNPGAWGQATGASVATRPFAYIKTLLAVLLSASLSGCATFDGLTSSSSDNNGDGGGASIRGDAHEPEVSSLSTAKRTSAQAGVTDEADLAAGDDVWEVVRRGRQIPDMENERVQRQVDWYQKYNHTLKRTSENAYPYLYHIVTEARRRDLPTELSLIPVIESGFRPFAHSPSGASGLWQFIPSTGRRYGLQQNWWYDGRRDVVASTRAAYDYLEYLYRKLDGDWLLAMAAYNAGEGTVLRAIRRNREAGKNTDYWSLKLPGETQRYVPRLLALAKIVSDPQHYGVNLVPVPNSAHFRVTELDSQIDLALVAEIAGLDMNEVYVLNPGYNRWATGPDGPHTIVVPVTSATRFDENLARLPAEKRVSWKRHEVRAGETLSGIALGNSTTVKTLQRVNELSGTNIRVGQDLLVPTSVRPLESYTLSADMRGAPEAMPNGASTVEYTVRSGDSLWLIARRHDVTVRKLTAWNGISRNATLRLGQKLRIHQSTPVATQVASATQSSPPGTTHLRYTVQHGDSLWLISRRFRVSVASLRRWNNMPGGKLLHPGQELDVYLTESQQFEI